MPANTTEPRLKLLSLLGDLPPRDRPVRVLASRSEQRDAYTLDTLSLDLNGIEPVVASMTRPRGENVPPVVVYNHAHGGNYGLGRRELTEGRKEMSGPPYAQALAERGMAGLCIDHWAFGDRAHRSESATFKHMLWHGQVMWGMMLFDSWRAVDFLHTREDVDHSRIGTVGMSMGGTMAWWLAATDERIAACVDICGAADYQSLIDDRALDKHNFYYYVPSLLKHFTAGEIGAMTAPRRRLSLIGRDDPLTPGHQKIDDEMKHAYAAAGAAGAWSMRTFDAGHTETAEMRAAALEFLSDALCS